MASTFALSGDADMAVREAVGELLTVNKWAGKHFINLPIIYPGGSFVTVRVEGTGSFFRVDDGGFAYREVENVGSERSFKRAADKVASQGQISANSRMLFVDVPAEQLARAICDVAIASRDVVEGIYSRFIDEDEAEMTERLYDRLARVFGSSRLDEKNLITGSSTISWNVSAIVHADSGLVVFQAVGLHPNSINKASTAFHDLQHLPKPPTRVAVVRDKKAFGAKIGLLSQAGRVIEGDQSDAVYLRAAA